MALFMVLNNVYIRGTLLPAGKIIDSDFYDLVELDKAGVILEALPNVPVEKVAKQVRESRGKGLRGFELDILTAAHSNFADEADVANSGGGGVTDQKVQIPFTGVMNGFNDTFTLPDKVVVATLKVYWNGIRLRRDAACDFIAIESLGVGQGFDAIQILRSKLPLSNDSLFADYFAQTT